MTRAKHLSHRTCGFEDYKEFIIHVSIMITQSLTCAPVKATVHCVCLDQMFVFCLNWNFGFAGN